MNNEHWGQELVEAINKLARIDGVITIMRPRGENTFDIELRYHGYTYIERFDTRFEERPSMIAVILLGTLFTDYYRAKQERL